MCACLPMGRRDLARATQSLATLVTSELYRVPVMKSSRESLHEKQTLTIPSSMKFSYR